ncbi:MAG: hypothetical protein Q7K37_02330 [Dehalococcoidia bacterium]|nr:hypothetical protein [Dehalococcoidia bacterium]
MPASAPSTPTATPDPTPPTEQAGAVTVPVASLETGVDDFARALLTGDMVALTRSFSPQGMQRAVALQDAAGPGAGTIVRVDVVSLDRGEPGAPADVVLELEVQGGSLTTVSVMQTTWQAQPPHGAWQIVDLSVRP